MARTVGESEAMACNIIPAEEERPYTWLEDYLERLEGREARQGYYEGYPTCESFPEAA